MFTKRTLALLLVGAALLAISAFVAVAQNDDDPTPPSYGWHGMMGMGYGMMESDDMDVMLNAVAQTLGIDAQTLVSELQSGKSFAQLAQVNDVDPADVWSAMQSEMQEHMQELVDAGTLTQAQADAHLAYMQSHWDDMPMFSGQGYGMMSMMGGMWGNYAPFGMMGRVWDKNNIHRGMTGRWH